MKKNIKRRAFFKKVGVGGAVAAATIGFPNIAKAATTLKVQAAWAVVFS